MSHTVNQYQIFIKRKTATLPVLALEHEIPVYQALHGNDSVTWPGSPTEAPEVYAEIEHEADAAMSLALLHRKFGDKATDHLNRIYPNPAVLAQVTGIPLARQTVGAFADPGESQSEQKDRKREAQLKAAAEKKAAKAKPEPLSLNRAKADASS